MRPHSNNGHRLWILTAFLVLVGIVSFAAAAPSRDPARLKELRTQAEIYEKHAEWEEACKIYEHLLRFDRSQKDLKDRYNHCMRRLNQVRRHRDLSYRKEVLSVETGQALRLYGLIVETMLENSLDPKKMDATRLFRKGLEELKLGLADPTFLQINLAAAKQAEIRAFRDYLRQTWGSMPIKTRAEAVKQVKEIALAAFHKLQLDPTVVVFEFTCGACYAVDEYTSYLTPIQLHELFKSLEGEFVGVGITLAMVDNRLSIAHIAPNSPAAEFIPQIKEKDWIISIDGKDTAHLTPEAALDLLIGPNGSMVNLVVESPSGMRVMAQLRRRPVLLPSIVTEIRNERLKIGVITLSYFQDTTLQELDSALMTLAKNDVKAVILDLRGNPGGLFESAIETAKRFLSSGVITSTQNSDPKFNTIYQSRNPDAMILPLVVLIDGGTASAAEVLAGALKENNRAQLVGQTTFGKGCTQTVVKLPPSRANVPTGGLRITVTRFFSPTGQPYSGQGVAPHIFADRFLDEMDDEDRQMKRALEIAQGQ